MAEGNKRILDISRIISGDSKEVKNFARTCSIWVYNTILNYVQNKEDAEEITQDTLLAALNGIKQFRSESALKTWVYGIALNKCRDFIKYKSRKKRSGQVIPLYNEKNDFQIEYAKDYFHPGVLLESKEQVSILFDAINQLKERQKAALILSKLDQKTQKEIAEIMETSTKAVESLLSRAKNNLRDILINNGVYIYKETRVKVNEK